MGTSGGANIALLFAIIHPEPVSGVIADSCAEFYSPENLRKEVSERRRMTNAHQFSPDGEILEMSSEELANCDGYNDYKYGLENRYGYAKSISKQNIRLRLTNRPVVFLLGQEDTERSWSLDKSCEVEVQGKNRYARGLLYKHHLTSISKGVHSPNHQWAAIAGVGHDSSEMLTHERFIDALKNLTH
jgi:pimeloyl-ACP methyl ester carboxylesterase